VVRDDDRWWLGVNASLDHDPRVVAAAISSLPGIGPHRLRLLINHLGALDAWRAVRGEVSAPGHVAAVLRENDLHRVLRRTATVQLLDRVAEALHAGNIRVLFADDAQYPASMRGDFAAPAVLFAIGDLAAFEQRRVGVIGTRAASASGRHFARRLGRELAANGVAVVSGLARGIDAAVHRGVLDAFGDEPQARRPPAAAPARPIAVVASGLDVVYPREHASLWKHVAERGVIVSESPPGCAPDAFRFPLRNRIVAALSEVVVVVESRERGGSLLTAADAIDRNVPVMAVPGPVDRRAASGVNQLLCDGATPVTGADDVLAFLSFQHQRAVATAADLRPRPRGGDLAAYRVVRDDPRTVDGVALALGASLVEAAMRLARLEADGWIAQADGWFECVGTPLT